MSNIRPFVRTVRAAQGRSRTPHRRPQNRIPASQITFVPPHRAAKAQRPGWFGRTCKYLLSALRRTP